MEKVKPMIADGITVSRMLFSLLLLALPPFSRAFMLLYLLCGVSDVLDGYLARKLHTESERGASLDSAADLLFTLAYAVRILPLLHIPKGIWVWTAGIAAVKTVGILQKSRAAHRLSAAHSFANRLTGILVFLLPLSACVIDTAFAAIPVCTVATLAAAAELRREGRKETALG